MPRGLAPRRPARTGRQDKVRTTTDLRSKKVETAARSSRGKSPERVSKGPSNGSGKSKGAAVAKIKGYDPVAPGRVTEILKRLD